MDGRCVNASRKADWNEIQRIVDSVEVPVIANGDVVDAESAQLCLETTHAAGLMIGRGQLATLNFWRD